MERANLFLSVQRALLGAIDTSVCAVCVSANDTNVKLTFFLENTITEDYYETLDIVGAEIMADMEMNSIVPVELHIIENASEPFLCSGDWVFLRLGFKAKRTID